ncbi:MAG: hypothetical protein Q8M92_05590 [Candidatus Subteraquimicrobiales bacterium]|nr:hypothetical protein [Candidatus Subteraquimicrobiales bacterium]
MKKKCWFIVALLILIFTIIFLCQGLIFAGEAHSAAEAHGDAHHAAPFYYYVQWVLLFLVLGLGLNYVLSLRFAKKLKLPFSKIKKVKVNNWIPPTLRPKHEGLAYIITGAVMAIFLIGYTPAVFNYHESTPLIVIRLVLYLLAGIFVTTYGVLGRHDEHEEEAHSSHGH